jgi:hypothetical protein
MSTAALRDTFNLVSEPKGIRCTGALLIYCDAKGESDGLRTHQRLVFNCVHAAGNATRQYTSDPLPPGSNATAAAQAMAQKAIGDSNDGPPRPAADRG